MWLVGHWQVDNRSTTQPAYQQVADRRGQWGTPITVQTVGGQQPGQKFFTGTQATIRFIDLPTPSEARHIPHHGQGIAVCWVDEDNPENTSAVFYGYVTNVKRIQHPSPTGTPWQGLDVTAQDWFGFWSQNYIDRDSGQPDDAWGVVQRRVCRHFGRLQAVRLGRYEDTRICASCFEEGRSGGENMREAQLATGTEMFQRHGHMIGQEPYPTDGTTVTGWWVRTPQVVMRRRTGEPQGDDTIGGSTTADQEIVAFSNVVREPGGIEVIAASVSTTVPKIPAFTPPRFSTQSVTEPPILHYVELTPGDSAGRSDNPPVTAEQQSADGWRQDKFIRTARLSRNDDAHRAVLQIAANRFVEGQTSHFDDIELTVENLSPAEIREWSKRSYGDELILNAYRDGVGEQRCMIRRMDWDINIGTATSITVGATPHISPPPVARWAADMIWRDGSFSSGYDFGPPRLGSLTPDHFDTTDGTEVRIRAILRRNDNGRVTVETETVAQMNLLEGWWLRLQLPNGRAENIQIGSTSSQIWTSTGEEIAAADTPDDGDTVRVGLFEQLPTAAIPGADVTVPDVIGLSQSAAEDAIRFAGLVPVGTEVTATSEADDDRTLTQFPSGGTTTSRGATVAFTYGSYTDVTQVAVPNVGNDTEADARATLVGAGLVVGTVTDENETSGADDRVIRTVPAAGTIVGVGSTVNIVLRNLVTTTRTVPATEGFTEAAARTALTNAGFVVGTVTNEDVTTGVDDTVLRTIPAQGSSVAEGSTVNIVLRNLQAVVPDLDGQTEAQARTALVALGFVVGAVTDENTTTGTDDTVIRTSPAAGSQINVGSTVGLVLRNLQVLVPDVSGQTDAAARSGDHRTANLVPGTTTDENQISGTDDRVIRTDPPAGSQVDDGTTVNIVLRNLQAVVPDLTGDTVAEAMAALTAVGLVLDTVFGTDVNTLVQGDDDRVQSQSVAAGSQVDDGTTVRVTLWNYNGAVVPNLVGLSRTAALAALTGAGLTGTATAVSTLVLADDEEVLSQATAAGTVVVSGSAVAFSYYDYVGAVVPNLVGLTRTQATAALTGVGLTGAATATDTLVQAEDEQVLTQAPAAGTTVTSGSQVAFTYGNYVGVTVPDVSGLSGTAAAAAIVAAGLVAAEGADVTVTVAAQDDLVQQQSPAAGTVVTSGSTVTYQLGDFVGTAVPNTVGLTETAARTAITGAGLVVGTVTDEDDNFGTDDRVIRTSPAAGTEVEPGSTVNIVLRNLVPLRAWNAILTIGSDGIWSGYDAGNAEAEPPVPAQGALSDDDYTYSGPGVQPQTHVIDRFEWDTTNNRIRIRLDSVAHAVNSSQGWYRIEFTGTAAGDVIFGPMADIAISGRTIWVHSELPTDITYPADETQIAVEWWTAEPVSPPVTAGYPLLPTAPTVTVPDLAGLTQAGATTTLTTAGLTLGTVTDQNVTTGTDDTVISQSPAAGSEVASGAAVNIVLRNLQAVVPDTAGQTEAQARTALTNAGFVVGTVTDENETSGVDDRVIRTAPAAGTQIDDGSTVNIVLRNLQAVVPDLDGLTATAAEAALTAVGLVGAVGADIDVTDQTENDLVQAQSPAAGVQIDDGSTVTYQLGNYVAAPVPMVLWSATMTGTTEGAWWGYDNRAGENEGSALSDTVAEDIEDADGNDVDVTIIHIDINDDVGGGQARMRLWTETAAQMNAIEGKYLRIELTDDIADDLIAAIPPSNTRANINIDNLSQADIPADGTGLAVSIWDLEPPANRVTTPGHPVPPPTPQVAVPDVVGDTVAEATTALTAAGLLTAAETTDVDTLIEANDNLVHSTSPAVGTDVDVGSTVSLVLWNFNGVTVPDIVGDPISDVETDIAALGLTLVQSDVDVFVAAQDNVVQTQTPAEDTIVAPGSTVTVTVGNLKVRVPAIVGSTQAAAEAALTAAGLTFTSTEMEVTDAAQVGLVQTQLPAESAVVDPGSNVAFVVGIAAPVTPEGRLFLGNLVVGAMGDVNRGYPWSGSSLTPDSFDADGTTVTVRQISWRIDPDPDPDDLRGTMFLGAGSGASPSPTEYDHLEGEWLRLEHGTDSFVLQYPTDTGNLGSVETPADTAPDWLLAVATGETVVVSIWDTQAQADAGGVPPVQVAVPDLTGLLEAAARTAIENAGLVAAFTSQNETSGTDDEVISQTPAAGTMVDSGSTVNVVIRNLQAVVPDTTGNTEATARTALTNAGFTVGTVTDENETSGTNDRVIRTDPAAGQQIDHGSTVNIVLRNLQAVVPDVAGQTEDAARTALSAAGFTVAVATTDVDTLVEADDDTVQSTSPAIGSQVDHGTEVSLVLWNFHGVTVPNLVGQTQTAAEASLTALGLTSTTVVGSETDDSDNENVVEAQSPAANTIVAPGSSVQLTIWDYEAVTPPTATPIWTATMVWGDGSSEDGFSNDFNFGGGLEVDTAFGALSNSTPTFGTTQVTFQRIARTSTGAIRITTGTSTQGQNFRALQMAALRGKWLRIELPEGRDAAVVQIPESTSDEDETFGAGTITDTEHAAIGRGTQVAVTLWDEDPTGIAATGGLPIQLQTTAITAAAIFVEEDANWFGFFDHTTIPLNSYGSATPQATAYPWQFNVGGENVRINRFDLRSNRRIRIVAGDSTDFDAIEGKWLRLDMPGVADPVVSQIPVSTNDRTPSSWRPLPESPDLPEVGEVMIASLWDSQSDADAGAPIMPGTTPPAPPTQVAVPDTAGNTEAAARTAITGAGLVVGTVTDENVTTGTDDTVIRTDPVAGTMVDPGSTVNIVLRNLQVVVPDTTGNTEAAARTALTNAGFVVGTVTDENQTSGTNDRVIRTDPAAGQQIDHGSTVNIVLRNLQAVIPTNIVGMTEDAARTALSALGFLVAAATTDVNTLVEADDDKVQATSPAAGSQIDHGSTVSLVLWNFNGVEVPNLVGQTQTEAETALTALGLTSTTVVGSETSDTDNENVVEAQSPAANMIVAPGSSVELTIWDYEAAPTLVSSATITVGSTTAGDGTWFGWSAGHNDQTHGTIDPDPWTFDWENTPNTGAIEVVYMSIRSVDGNSVFAVADNNDAFRIDGDLWLKLILPGRTTAIVAQLEDPAFQVPRFSFDTPIADVPEVGETMTVELWDAEPSATIVQKLWSSVMTWGIHPTTATPRAGYSHADSDSAAYGSLEPVTIPADDNFATAVTFERIARLIGENIDKVRIDTGAAAQYAAIAGKWLRLETTGQPDGDVIFQIPTSTSSGQTTGVVFVTNADPPVSISSPAEGTQIAVSIWDSNPRGQDATENYPVDPVQALWSGTITWQRAGGQGGWRSTGGSPYGSISPSPVTFAHGINSITVTDLYRWGNNDMRFGTGNHAGNYAAAEGLWIKFELEDGDVVAQVSDESLGTTLASCTPTGVFSGNDRPESGDQIPVSIWEDDPR